MRQSVQVQPDTRFQKLFGLLGSMLVLLLLAASGLTPERLLASVCVFAESSGADRQDGRFYFRLCGFLLVSPDSVRSIKPVEQLVTGWKRPLHRPSRLPEPKDGQAANWSDLYQELLWSQERLPIQTGHNFRCQVLKAGERQELDWKFLCLLP
jgi:hypothetical protein